MTTMKALRQLEYSKPLDLCDIPIPSTDTGTAVIRILAASIISYTREVYDGTRKYPYPTPLTVGSSAIGRVHALPPDSTSLNEGDLIFIDITFRSRDDPSHVFLSAIMQGFTAGSKKLMSHWRDGSYAEYMAMSLENIYPVSEHLLKSADQGGFGSAAVHIALGRNKAILDQLASFLGPKFPPGRLVTVPITSDVDSQIEAIKAAAGDIPIDAYLDIWPPSAFTSEGQSPYFKACIMSLRHSGRVSLMGGQMEVTLPHSRVMHWNLSIRGKWVFERQDARSLIKMVEGGLMLLGEKGGFGKSPKAFALAEWKEAFDNAMENVGFGGGTYFKVGEC